MLHERSAGHGQKFGLRSGSRRFACLAEKRFREERKVSLLSGAKEVDDWRTVPGSLKHDHSHSERERWMVQAMDEASDYFPLTASHWMSMYVNLDFTR